LSCAPAGKKKKGRAWDVQSQTLPILLEAQILKRGTGRFGRRENLSGRFLADPELLCRAPYLVERLARLDEIGQGFPGVPFPVLVSDRAADRFHEDLRSLANHLRNAGGFRLLDPLTVQPVSADLRVLQSGRYDSLRGVVLDLAHLESIVEQPVQPVGEALLTDPRPCELRRINLDPGFREPVLRAPIFLDLVPDVPRRRYGMEHSVSILAELHG